VNPYAELPGLEALYLEDSYVLGVREEPSEVRIGLEAVLTEDHPSWSPPKPDEQYAYRRIELVFPNTRRVDWVEKSMTPFRDGSGEIDYGNIDSFEWQPGFYDLRGDWGHLRIESDEPVVVEP
jgi:hypothetical protein